MLRRAVLVLAVLAAGCLEPDAPLGDRLDEDCGDGRSWGLFGTAKASQPTPPIEHDLRLCDPAAFFAEGSPLEFRLTVNGRAEHVLAGVELPAGTTWVTPIPRVDATLEPGEHVLRGVARGEAGTHVLRGWSSLPAWSANGSRIGGWDLVGVRGDAAAAERFAPCAVRYDPCQPTPDVRIRMTATSERASHVEAHVVSDEALEGTAMFWTGAEFADGWRTERVRLEPNVERTFATDVVLPQAWLDGGYGGHYQAWFYLYPDPWQDWRIHDGVMHWVAVEGRPEARPGPGAP